MAEASDGMPAAGSSRQGGGPLVVRQSSLQRDGLFGGLVAVFLLALVRGLAGAQTSGGRIAVVAFVCLVVAGLTTLWVRTVTRPCRLEVTPESITLVDSRGGVRTLSRESGGELRLVRIGSGRYRQTGMTVGGSGIVLPLPFFSIKHVRLQTAAAGWTFASGRPGR
jgi:hypothetical protein